MNTSKPSRRARVSWCVALVFLQVTFVGAAPADKPAGIDRAGMDLTVKPGDDFNRFANGTWLAQAEIPADESRWGAGSMLTKELRRRLIELIQAAAVQPKTTAERTVAAYYTAYMDTARIEARKLEPLQPLLRKIDAIADKAMLAEHLGASLRADVDALNNTKFYTENLFGLWVVQGLEDPDHYVPYLLQGGLGLPDRAYYLDDNPKMDDVRAKYRAHIAKVLALAGIKDPEAKAGRIFALEHKLAASHATREESVDVLKANNPWKRGDFAQKAPGMDWKRFFEGAALSRQNDFIVWHPTAVSGAAALVGSADLADWKDYLVFHALNHFSGVLPKAFSDERFAFYGTVLSGTPVEQERPKRAVESANALIGDLVGQVYVAKYFPPQNKARIGEMVQHIVAAFERRVGQLEWMAPATKQQAVAKLKALYVGIGYPDHWADYTGLKIDPADAVGNAMRAEEFLYRRALAKLGRPVDRTEWCMVAQIVNAVNMPLQNALDFPAGILQPPYFDPNAPDAVNYGSIGAIIGHEISHSFDDQGSQFDAAGRLRDWWTPDDAKHFKEQSAALVAQYSAYRPLADLAVNGQLTLSENLADLAGLAAAYDGYKAATAGKPAQSAGPYTDDQLFFIAYAQSWRSKSREPALRNQLLTDGHAPASFRALTVRNLDPWYTAFAVRPGEKLYLEPRTRVRVW